MFQFVLVSHVFLKLYCSLLFAQASFYFVLSSHMKNMYITFCAEVDVIFGWNVSGLLAAKSLALYSKTDPHHLQHLQSKYKGDFNHK